MSCNLNEIMNDSMDELRELVQGKAASIDVGADYATFNWGPDFKVKRRDQAVKAANGKQVAIEKWAEKKFGPKFAKGWSRVTETDTRVMLDYNFSAELKKAYQVKIEQDTQTQDFQNNAQQANEYVVDGEVMPVNEDIFGDEMALNKRNTLEDDVTKIDFDDYLSHKRELIKIMERKLSDLYQKRKNDKSDTLKEEIDRVRNIKMRFEEEVTKLADSVNPLEDTFQIFEADIELIKYLTQGTNPPIQQLYEAEDIMAYLVTTANTSGQNKYNRFVLDGASKISFELESKLHDLSREFNALNDVIYDAKKEYLLKIIDESPKLRGMFPDKELAEIREELLADHEGMSFVSAFFMPTGKQIQSKDSQLAQMIRMEVDKKRGEAKTHASKLIGMLTDMTPRINKILQRKGHNVTWTPLKNTLFSNYTYDIFQQFDTFGNRTSRLISKFSAKWQTQLASKMTSLNERMTEAISANDPGAKNSVLAEKFNWLNQHAEFLDITRVPEIIEDDLFKGWKARFNDAEAHAYKAEIVSKIGVHEYNKMIEKQKDMLEEYRVEMKNTIGDIFAGEGVTEFDELSYEAQFRVKLITAVNDPFQLLDSQKADQGGKVDVVHGNSSEQYHSQLKFNTYFPRKEVTNYDTTTEQVVTEDSKFYDDRFSEIEEDIDLYDYWNLLNESAEFINMSIADGRTRLHTNSLPKLAKNIVDMLLDRNLQWSERTMILRQSTVDFIKDSFSMDAERIDRGEEINKGQLANTVQSEVSSLIRTNKMKLNRIRPDGFTKETRVLDLTQESQEVIQYFNDLTGTTDFVDLANKVGTVINVQDVMKSFLTNEVMEQQTLNLPVIMRAYLDMAAEYKARKDAHPTVKLMKDLYNGIDPLKSKKQKDFDQDGALNNARKYYQMVSNTAFGRNRNLAKNKMDDFYRRNILATSDTENWLNLTFLGKNYSQGQKNLKTELEYRIETLDKKIEEATDIDDEQAVIELTEMKDKIQNELDNLGKTYTLAASYHSVLNRYSIFKGLAWNIKAATINRFQGWFQGVINDTGKYWKKGNFILANSFINRKMYAKINPKSRYAEEMRKTEVLMARLDILQDATNEIDRARNDSGSTGLFKKIQPFYLTEMIEWHNQTPEILSIIMDQEITDMDGNTVPVFDGRKFAAHDLVNGQLVLRPEYRTEENITTWESFDSAEFRDMKGKISATISVLNGDYSKTGTTMIKSFVLGKSLTMFKTWLSMQVWQRFAYKQSDIELGIKDFDGFYTGSFKSEKTRGVASAAGLVAIGAATLTTLPLGIGGALVAGMAAYMYKQYHVNKNRTANDEMLEDVQYGRQLMGAVKAILFKGIAIPVNSIRGRQIIKEYEFDDLDLTDQERQNIHTLLNEITLIMGGVAMKAMLAALLTGDEEEEPMTVKGAGSQGNRYVESKAQKEKRKAWSNLIENYSTRVIDDITLYYNPNAFYNTLKVDGVGRIMEQMDALAKALMNGDVEKLEKNAKALTLPSVVKGWGGFKPLTEMEYENNEVMDQFFKSDYKKERNQLTQDRADFTEKLTEELLEKYDYDNLSPAAQVKVDAKIKKKVAKAKKKGFKTPDRRLFDEDQNRID